MPCTRATVRRAVISGRQPWRLRRTERWCTIAANRRRRLPATAFLWLNGPSRPEAAPHLEAAADTRLGVAADRREAEVVADIQPPEADRQAEEEEEADIRRRAAAGPALAPRMAA